MDPLAQPAGKITSPPMPPRPDPPEKPRGTWLAIVLMGSGALALIVVLTFLTLGFFGPLVLIGLGVFLIIGLQYLLWGWWFERIYRSQASDEEVRPRPD
ncbi:MAG TPA: hypothetical protein VFB80_05165 [Pirellulaceae bacterium]|nr:hypothetical protein [Pirellulaceae bacterium]